MNLANKIKNIVEEIEQLQQYKKDTKKLVDGQRKRLDKIAAIIELYSQRDIPLGKWRKLHILAKGENNG